MTPARGGKEGWGRERGEGRVGGERGGKERWEGREEGRKGGRGERGRERECNYVFAFACLCVGVCASVQSRS